jgi:hypothetical protein
MTKANEGSATLAVEKPGTRAVLRRIEPGEHVICPHCGERVKFRAKRRSNKVICNVYVRGKWDRVEHYHDTCYKAAGEPHGSAGDKVPRRVDLRRKKPS